MRGVKMQEYDLFRKLERVEAPENFEQGVMQLLYERRRKQVRVKTLRLSLAGALGAAVAVFVIINLFILPQKGPAEFSELERETPALFERMIPQRTMETVPIIERVDYSGEIRSRRQEPPTIYILEQCSDQSTREIKY
jgi:DNA-binding HxlR family transcriptional regulator